MYAIIEEGGRQHKVTSGDTIRAGGVTYHVLTAPPAARPDLIVANAALRYPKVATAGQPGRAGLIIMAAPAGRPVSATQLRAALNRKQAQLAGQAATGHSLILFSKVGGSSGPLVGFTKLLDAGVTDVDNLTDRIPGIGTALSALVAIGGISKVIGLKPALAGVHVTFAEPG